MQNNSEDSKLLHSLDKRVAVIEERSKDLKDIKVTLEKVEVSLASLKVRVATISAGCAIAVSFLVRLLTK